MKAIEMTEADSITSGARSATIYDRALKVLPGGCSRNAILRKPHPFYAASASGFLVTDVEGVERVDFANNMTSQIHGHADPRITAAVTAQIGKGTAFAFGTEIEVDYAEHLVSRAPSFEKLRFVNSGTEAIMACLKAARAFTGRAKIAKVEGAYHGLYDYAEVSQTATPANWGEIDRPSSSAVSFGTPQAVLDDVVVLPFNDPARAVALLDAHADEIACILIDPMPHRAGVIPATDDFIVALRHWATGHGALLVFDEVITFRSTYGGAQAWYSVSPDLTAMGKMIGGGFPVGALAGRADVMAVMDPSAGKLLFPHSGTFSANPVTMTAGLVAMQAFDCEAVDALNRLAVYAHTALRAAIEVAGVPCCVTGRGSMFKLHFRHQAPTTYREAYVTPHEGELVEKFLNLMFDEGIILINSCSATLSTPMTAATVDRLAESVAKALKVLAPDIRELVDRRA